MIYNVPGFTGYDIPAEVVVELANHPNIIGMKESGGDVEKIRKMAEATRHVKRSVTVTETFDAVTPRMLKASSGGNGQGGELVQVAGVGRRQAVVGRGDRGERNQNPPEGSGIPDHGGAGAEAGAVACRRVQWADPGLCRCGADRLLRDLRCLEGRRCGAGPPEAGADHRSHYRVAGELGIPGLKYGMDLNGYYGGPARLPFLPLTADLKSEVERLLADIRN